jgi:hypothetical protein
MRPPGWRPSDELASATRAALAWWYERNPRRRRPATQTERDEQLAYAWTFHTNDCGPTQVRWVASKILERTKGHWPDHFELEELIREGRSMRAQKDRAGRSETVRWSGREDDWCPQCKKDPIYTAVDGAWMYELPCTCDSSPMVTFRGYSLWLRGVRARPEDDPYALARLYREAAEQLVTEWRVTGRTLASVISEIGAVRAENAAVEA